MGEGLAHRRHRQAADQRLAVEAELALDLDDLLGASCAVPTRTSTTPVGWLITTSTPAPGCPAGASVTRR